MPNMQTVVLPVLRAMLRCAKEWQGWEDGRMTGGASRRCGWERVGVWVMPDEHQESGTNLEWKEHGGPESLESRQGRWALAEQHR